MSAGTTEMALARVNRHGRRIIEAELARLERRNLRLGPDELAAIDQALGDVHERLVLRRLKLLAARRPDLMDAATDLFAAEARLPE